MPAQQYLGSSAREPRRRFGEHRRDIMDGKVEKAVPCHFANTNSSEDDLVFAPFRRVRSDNPWVLRHLESNAINEYNLVEAGVNRILT